MRENLGYLYARQDTTPPYQPVLLAKTTAYKERLLIWHSVGMKREALFYSFTTASSEESCRIDLIPDACINILFECCPHDPKAIVSGIHLELNEVLLKPDTSYFGFKPYSDRGFKLGGIRMPELVNGSVDLLEVFPGAERMLLNIANSTGLDAQIQSFDAYAKTHMIQSEYQPSFVDFFTYLLCVSRGTVDLNEMQNMTGYSKRYCRERFKEDHGISPKQYSNIMRFQRTIKQLMRGPKGSLTLLAAENGYYDQAHFIHDFKQYVKMAPSRFRQEYLQADAG